MLVTLGFLCATLLALAAVPALARRAERLARKRAEAAFPLSLAEIAADRDHLRAELALRARTLEHQDELGFAAKAGTAASASSVAQRKPSVTSMTASIKTGRSASGVDTGLYLPSGLRDGQRYANVPARTGFQALRRGSRSPAG